jgi:transcriptional regulator with XRE-family HTH domain
MATPREQLADVLRQSRIDAGYAAQRDLAKVLTVSRPVITRAENPREPVPSPGLLAAWAKATNAPIAVLNDYATRARSPRSWFAKWADDFEQRATMLRWFEPLLVPGLLQTENYARALVSWKPFSSDDTDARLNTRLARQSVLERAELRVLILGSVLNREVGDASVMSEQIAHLLNLGSRSSITIQLVPDTPDVAGALGGAFAIATEGAADTAAYADSLVQSGVYTDTSLISRAGRVWDGLRADALPWGQTRDLLGKAGEKWKTQT